MVRRFSVATFVPVSLCLLAACAGPLPIVTTGEDVRASTGLDRLVEFRVDADPVDAPSEAGEARDSLTAREAVERGVHRSAALQAALARVQVALAEAEQARLFANPLLSVVGRWGNGPMAFEASLSAPFVQMLQTRRRASAADRRLERAASEAVAEAVDVLAETQRRYADAQKADAEARIEAERLRGLEQLLALAESRVRNGEGTAFERAQAEDRRFGSSQRLAAARREAHAARLQLAEAVGQPSAAADWKLDPLAAPAATSGTEQDWVASALQRRPDLHALAFELEALGDEAALAVFWPWQAATLGAETQRTPAWFTGPNATVPLPIFDDGAAESRRVNAEVAAARHRITAAARRVVAEVRTAHAASASLALELAQLRTEGMPQKQRAVDAAKSANQNGEIGREPVLLAEQELLAARAAEASLAHEAVLAGIRLQRAVGGIDAAARVASPESNDESPNARREGEAQ